MRNSRKPQVMAAGLLAGVAVAALAANPLASASASRAVAARIAAWPGASVANVSADLWRGKVVLEGLDLPGKGVAIHAGRVTLPGATGGFALVSPAMALDGAASADNLVIDAGMVTYKIAHVEASGTTMTAADLAALVDPKSTVPAAERLAALNAAAISAPEAIGTVKIGDVSETITYTDVKLANVVKGKIGAASIAGTRLAISKGKDAPVTVNIPNTTAKNIDLTLMARLLTQARTDPNEPLGTLYDSFSADGFTVSGVPDVNISMGRISGSGVKGRAMATPYLQLMDKFAKSTAGKRPEVQDAQDLAKGYADMLRSVEIGSFEMRDFAIAAQDKGKPVAVKIGRIAVNSFAAGKLGEIVYEGFDVNAEEAKVKLANFSMRGFDFRPLLVMADAFAAKGEEAMNDPAALRSYIPTLDHAGLNGLDLDAAAEPGKPGNAANGKRNQFQLASLALDAGDFIGGIPSSATMTADHFVMDLSGLLADPDMRDFAALGYKGVDFSSKLDIGWNEAASELQLKTLSGSAAGMGSVKLAATLGNVSKDLFSANSSEALAAAMGALAKKVDFTFANDGIVEKAIEVQAKQAKKPVDETRKTMIAGVSAMIPAMLGNAPAARDIANALAKFLANPKTLHVTAASATGLGIGDLDLINQPAELLGKLQVKAVANE